MAGPSAEENTHSHTCPTCFRIFASYGGRRVHECRAHAGEYHKAFTATTRGRPKERWDPKDDFLWRESPCVLRILSSRSTPLCYNTARLKLSSFIGRELNISDYWKCLPVVARPNLHLHLTPSEVVQVGILDGMSTNAVRRHGPAHILG